MSRSDEFHGVVDPTRGTPGKFVLNQKTQKFQDRRTKRNRDKPTQNRKAIERSQRGE